MTFVQTIVIVQFLQFDHKNGAGYLFVNLKKWGSDTYLKMKRFFCGIFILK